MCQEDKVVIAGRISDYLRRHGGAGDSFQGIVAWWLMRQRYEESAACVREAVDFLYERGEIVKDVAADGSVRYFAAPSTGTPR
ncbi:hypothetical protein [Paraburkholderia caribensis]|uniref:hypothetical protein n=1 Tax=Paraburkholderia caribensis TaxID=75105 RepID=UPI001D05F5CD|nr:hypothetical protein [Paraburkholderia caribensis]